MPNLISKNALPQQVSEHLTKLGQRIRIARIRRDWSIAVLAEKAQINRNTVTAIEQGKPGVALGGVITVLWALGLDQSLHAVADVDADLHGKALEAAKRPMRAGKARKLSNTYDF